jgi:hypothetical protein
MIGSMHVPTGSPAGNIDALAAASSLFNGALPLDSGEVENAESILSNLANVFFQAPPNAAQAAHGQENSAPTLEARYKVLLDQIPAVVFMAYLDQGIGEAYVSPQIEETLGFTQEQWLEDPVRWYNQLHPDDKARWCNEAAEMFLTGSVLRSAYRVGFIAKRGWCAAGTDSPGSFMESDSTSRS